MEGVRDMETWPDDALERLLRLRPDLATPLPSSLTALAARAATSRSITRALAGLDAPTLAMVEAVVALHLHEGAVTVDRLRSATGIADPETYLTHLADLALVELDGGARPAPGLAVALGPAVAGLGPVTAQDAGLPTSRADVEAHLAQAPAAARRVLEALAWGPPVATMPSDSGGEITRGVRWLLAAHLLVPGEPGHVLLPGRVGLAWREGRTHRDLLTAPPLASAAAIDAATVRAESTQAAETLVRHLGDLASAWAAQPPAALRSGGVGVRDVRRLAGTLDVSPEAAGLLIELAWMSGLLGQGHDADGSWWAPTRTFDVEPTEQWAVTVLAWTASIRATHLVGTRTEGRLLAPLDPDLVRTWWPTLRARVLVALAQWPAGSAPSRRALADHLAWTTPRAAPPDELIDSVLHEAALLGLTGAGALTSPGRVLAHALDSSCLPDVAELAEALTADLPPAVEDLLLQADLTGIVPGRPCAPLAALLEATSEIESRGSAVTVRFTAESLGRAHDAGWSSTRILDSLEEFSRTGVPQPLEYAVRDVGRRRGSIRLGAAASYLRTEDADTLASLLGEPALGQVLRPLSPTVAASPLSAAALARELAAAGRAAQIEDASGAVVDVRGQRGQRGFGGPGAAQVWASPSRIPAPRDQAVDLTAAVAALRSGQARAGAPESADPPHALAQLRKAAADQTSVWLSFAGPTGVQERRWVQPLRVEAGRVVVRDADREADLTVAPHRIIAVSTSG